MTARDISDELGISVSQAYKIVRTLNRELAEKGFIVVSGKVPRAYWNTKFFGEENKEVS